MCCIKDMIGFLKEEANELEEKKHQKRISREE